MTSSPASEVALGGSNLYTLWNRNTTGTHVAVINGAYTRQGAIFLYGPSTDCLVARTAWLDEGTGTWVYVPAETPPKPAGCPWG